MAKTETIGEAIAAVAREEWPRWKSGGQPVLVDPFLRLGAIIDEGMPAHEARLVSPGEAATVRIVNVGETDK